MYKVHFFKVKNPKFLGRGARPLPQWDLRGPLLTPHLLGTSIPLPMVLNPPQLFLNNSSTGLPSHA